MKIKICKKYTNINKLQNKLSHAFPGDVIVVKKCLDLCKICKHQPVAEVNKKKLKASNISKLITKIEAKR